MSFTLPLIPEIVEGDALAVVPFLPEKSVDVVITSPRYNFKKNYPGVSDDTSMDAYFLEMLDLGSALFRVVKDDGVTFLNVGCRASNPLHDIEVAQCFIKAGWVLQERIIWQKADEQGNGHFTPINSNRYLNNLWESIFLFSKTGKVELDRLAIGVPYKDQTNTTRWKHGRSVHCRGDIWYIPYETIQNRAKERDGHEATFPKGLVTRCLSLVEKGRKNLVVLDPCCGVGTVPTTAISLGHLGLGVDLSGPMAAAASRNLDNSLTKD